MMNRKTFLKKSAMGIGIAGATPFVALPKLSQEEPAPVGLSTVKEFVVAGHKNLDKLKEMLDENPNLIYCRYDWGNGDFEEAIEGAGHLGNKEIANFLIDRGARVNLFVMTMLGKAELVKPVLDAYPQLIHSLGPHGFTLLHHAKVGGSEEMMAYLNEKGLSKTHVKIK